MKKAVKPAKHLTKEKRKKTGTTANTLWRADQAQMALTESNVLMTAQRNFSLAIARKDLTPFA